MKKLTLLACIICCYTIVFAQDDDKTPNTTTYEFATNATGIANLLLGGDGNVQNQTDYLFTYKAIGQEGHAFRMGLGGKLDYSRLPENERKNYTGSFDIRLGYERQWNLSPKWLTYVGLDFIGGYADFGSQTDFVKTQNISYNFGTGPLWGIQWMINEHISLYTETAFYYRHISTTSKVTFDGQANNDPETTTEDQLNFILPASLYLAVRF